MMACPAGTNAGRYVSLIAEGRFEEAYRYARDPNPMASVCGRVCAHPCETACRRGEIDRPISIRALEAFSHGTVWAGVAASARRRAAGVPKAALSVAIVGSGPVGLSAAHDLALLGYSVTIFEAASGRGRNAAAWASRNIACRASVVEAQIREILETGDVTLHV
jgi:formate dehydrogenase beta subunit